MNESGKGAIISKCGKYRYSLWRNWDDMFSENRKVMFIGLNPSTADAVDDDNTMRRCIGFAQKFGFSGLYMANLFALRSTDPEALKTEAEPVGKLNNGHLLNMAQRSDKIIACWGRTWQSYAGLHHRHAEVLRLLKYYDIYALKMNSDGSPAHPLFLPKTCELQLFHNPFRSNKGGNNVL